MPKNDRLLHYDYPLSRFDFVHSGIPPNATRLSDWLSHYPHSLRFDYHRRDYDWIFKLAPTISIVTATGNSSNNRDGRGRTS